MRQIFLDCDGVLADFDTAARDLFGRDSREAEELLGTDEFWNRIVACGDFYRKLTPLPDAGKLYRAIAHYKPIILTGCPKGGWSEQQKVEWAAEHFPNVRMITCMSKEKYLHIQNPGDVLVDDYLRYKDLWESAGGIFVHHQSANASIERLAELGFSVRVRTQRCD